MNRIFAGDQGQFPIESFPRLFQSIHRLPVRSRKSEFAILLEELRGHKVESVQPKPLGNLIQFLFDLACRRSVAILRVSFLDQSTNRRWKEQIILDLFTLPNVKLNTLGLCRLEALLDAAWCVVIRVQNAVGPNG